MQLHQETSNRQGVIAIRSFEKEISEGLSNLFITEYREVNVFSVYSDLTKNLQAYKVLSKSSLGDDSWLNSGFNKKLRMDFNPDFSFIPGKFATAGTDMPDGEIAIEFQHVNGYMHYSGGLLKYHAGLKTDAVYLYRTADTYSVFVFQGRVCVFANSFKCENENEVLYFILNALDINGMKQENTSLRLDFSLIETHVLPDYFRPYFMSVEPLRLVHPDIDDQIPMLHEMLFPNYLLSLCV
jgi:hypothetical protein